MAKLTATEAAQLAGVSRQTIHRWRKSGELSYLEKTDQGFLYEPSEILRVAQNKNASSQSVTRNSNSNNKMLQNATRNDPARNTVNKSEEKIDDGVTHNSNSNNKMLRNATSSVTASLQQQIKDISQKKEEALQKQAIAQKEIELLREQIDDIKKDKDRIFSLIEKNTLLLEHIQEENKDLKRKVDENQNKKKWWFF